jgi:hypothetical protein
MSWLRRLLVTALAVVILLETGGVARALGGSARIDCCCGVHSSARGCHCRECPVKLRKERVDLGAAQLGSARDCSGGADEPGVLAVVALLESVPTVTAPAVQSALVDPIVRAWRPRFVSPVRPPP